MATAPPSDRMETAHRRARRRAVRARLAAAVAAAAVAWWAHAAAAEPIAQASQPSSPAATIEQRPLGEPNAAAPAATSGAADLVRTAASLALVLSIIGGAWWWLRRSGMAPASRGGAFEVLARHSVGRGQHVLIARFGTRLLCVQQTRDGLRTLSELSNADEVAAMLATLRSGLSRSTALAARETDARSAAPGAAVDLRAPDMRTVDLRGGRAA